jgi:hypothetical protein
MTKKGFKRSTLAAGAWLTIALLADPGLLKNEVSAQSKPASTSSTAKPAAATTAGSLPAAELDKLLAPIALYPDALLAQMLQAAQNPQAVAGLHLWLGKNTNLKGTELQDAATKAGFEASHVALTLFPDVVKRMADELEWTIQLGKAFTANRSAVFDSIQRLRAQAQKAGTLKSTPQQEVETQTTSSGQQVIVIEPANPQIVYVPTYNPQTVYVTTPATTTVVVQENNSTDAVVAGVIGFTAGIAIGATMNNSYYYGPRGWYGGAYMYNDAWDDYYDFREDQREDWMDHREDIVEERGDRAENAREQRTDRQENRVENRPESQAQRTERQANRQQTRSSQGAGTQSTRSANAGAATQSTRSASAGTATASTSSTTSNAASRGYSNKGQSQATRERSASSSDAFSGYSSGSSTRSSSARGSSSRGSRSGGGGSRSGGGGRRR